MPSSIWLQHHQWTHLQHNSDKIISFCNISVTGLQGRDRVFSISLYLVPSTFLLHRNTITKQVQHTLPGVNRNKSDIENKLRRSLAPHPPHVEGHLLGIYSLLTPCRILRLSGLGISTSTHQAVLLAQFLFLSLLLRPLSLLCLVVVLSQGHSTTCLYDQFISETMNSFESCGLFIFVCHVDNAMIYNFFTFKVHLLKSLSVWWGRITYWWIQ